MDAAESLVLDHGFGGTTVDAVLERAGVTKGAFFHHFATKAELGLALVERYAERDAAHLDRHCQSAEQASDDPLEQLLHFVRLFEDEMRRAPVDSVPGCLFAAYCYQKQLFDETTLQVARQAMVRWRTRLSEMLSAAADANPPVADVDLEAVADMMLVVFEGAFVVARTRGETPLIAEQLAQYKTYLRLLFGGGGDTD
jgi:TetR/AcrR family transcriptional regulator, transcriptional repressor for nem operon